MKNMGKTLRIAHHKGEETESAINNYLQSYCATPHPATGETPAALLFQGRNYHNYQKIMTTTTLSRRTSSTLLAHHNKKYPKQYEFQKGDAVLKQNDVRKGKAMDGFS